MLQKNIVFATITDTKSQAYIKCKKPTKNLMNVEVELALF